MRRAHLTMRTEGITAFSNRYGVVVWTGENDTKTISVDGNLFENGAKQLRFRLKTDQCGQGLIISGRRGGHRMFTSPFISFLCKFSLSFITWLFFFSRKL